MSYDLKDCVSIDPLDIEAEFVRLPSDLAYWSQQYADAYEAWLDAKIDRETLYGQLYEEKLLELESQISQRPKVGRGKGVSDVMLEAAIKRDQEYIFARKKEIKAESEKVRLHGVLEALGAKKDGLVSIGATRRAEMERDPMIRDRSNIDREIHNNRGQAAEDG